MDARPWPFLIALGSLACGSSAPTPAQPPPAVLHVAGTYDTAVALVADSCGGTSVMPNPTRVDHDAGASRLTLTHAGIAYGGAIAPDARFTTDPRSLAGGLQVAIAGRFSSSGFEAQATVDQSGPACRYVVAWTGTKQGAPNVIP